MDLKKYKVTVVRPYDEEYNFKDGEIFSFGEVTDESYHAIYLYEYGIKTYGKDSIFSILNGCYMPNVFAYFLAEYYNNVVFLNVVDRNLGRSGILYLPSNLSTNQKKSVNEMIKSLDGYVIDVNKDLEYIDGFVESEKYRITSDGSIEIFSNIEDNKKKA